MTVPKGDDAKVEHVPVVFEEGIAASQSECHDAHQDLNDEEECESNLHILGWLDQREMKREEEEEEEEEEQGEREREREREIERERQK